MATVRAIRSEEDYDAALARITELMDALSGLEGQVDDVDDPNRIELDVLTDLVELFEERRHPIGFPDSVSAIMFRMDQANLTPRDLVPFIGSRAKVSEVLAGKRAITMSMPGHFTNTWEYRPTSCCRNRGLACRTQCQVLSLPGFLSELWPRQVGSRTSKT